MEKERAPSVGGSPLKGREKLPFKSLSTLKRKTLIYTIYEKAQKYFVAYS